MSEEGARLRLIEKERRERFLSLLGEFTLNWNFSEIWLRQLVQNVSAPSIAGWVLTVDMSTAQLLNALKALANDFCQEPAKTHLLNVHDGIDALRSTRNLYVHGIVRVSVAENWTSSLIQSYTARGGRLKALDIQVLPEHLEKAVVDSGAWAEYARQVLECLVGLKPAGWAELVVPELHSSDRKRRLVFGEQGT